MDCINIFLLHSNTAYTVQHLFDDDNGNAHDDDLSTELQNDHFPGLLNSWGVFYVNTYMFFFLWLSWLLLKQKRRKLCY